jgi:phenylpropionate dioxygenase-like ring-hydroxylating dioxygenase large terminal subunit
MLSVQDHDIIVDTNKGTPMGELFRRFWLPVALSQELPGPDCAPLRVKIMNEDLIAFRDTSGRPGLVDAYCPHRGAPMFFGRNEEDGLRCVYHGWKFDVTGTCVDLPNAPEGETFKNKVRITAYPCEDRGDIIWAYLGPIEKKPPFPDFEWTKLPKSHRYVTKFIEQCNYLQAMEGDYDPSHARFLHSVLDGAPINTFANQGQQNQGSQGSRSTFGTPATRGWASSDPNEPFPRAVGDRRVRKEDPRASAFGNTMLVDHEQAMLSVNMQETSEGKYQASVGVTWWMPLFCTAGISAPGHFSSNMRIPINNESLMFYRLRWSWEPITEDQLAEYKHGGYTHPELIPGSWMPKANLQNDYEIDRVAQKYFSYSGIKTFPLQDIALIEAQWGPISKHWLEHLVSSDYMIIYVRRRLLKAAKELMQGIEPVGPSRPDVYHFHRATAVGDTPEEAIAKAREEGMRPLLREKLPQLVVA